MCYYDGGNTIRRLKGLVTGYCFLHQQLQWQQQAQSSFSKNITSSYQLTITTFAIRGLMPVIYFKFISQLDVSEYQKTSDLPQFLQTNK